MDDADLLLWDALVDSASTPDIYYRPGYVCAYAASGHGRAIALLVESADMKVLFPLLLRDVSEISFANNVAGYDAATPYGYGGLLVIAGPTRPRHDQVQAVLRELRRWCRENGVVSLLLRLHPLLKQEDWLAFQFEPDCRPSHSGHTIAIDLSRWNETANCIATLQKGRRSDLNFARRSLQLTWASERNAFSEDIALFHKLYEYRMDQLKARAFYHFPPNYYTALATGLGSRLDVAIAWLKGEPVGAALFMSDRDLAHYHLSASNESGRTHKAATLILNGAATWARARGCQYLHLGGGTGEADKLFAFKNSFSGDVFQYSSLGVITDRSQYDMLVRQRVAATYLGPLQPDPFPEYRG